MTKDPHPGDTAETTTIAGRPAAGKAVTLPFTMQDLVPIYLSLQTADEREAFWVEVREKCLAFTGEQKALFVVSWSDSLHETSLRAEKVIEETRQFILEAKAMGWTFPEDNH